MCCKACPDGMIPRTVTCQGITAVWTCREQFCCAHVAHMQRVASSLGKCLKKTEVKIRLLLVPELFYPTHDTPPAWCMKPLVQTRSYMNLFYRTVMPPVYLLKVHMQKQDAFCLIHVKEEDYREGICLLQRFCKQFFSTSNAFCQNNAIYGLLHCWWRGSLQRDSDCMKTESFFLFPPE